MREVTRTDGVDYVKESSHDWQKIGWLLKTVQHECDLARAIKAIGRSATPCPSRPTSA